MSAPVAKMPRQPEDATPVEDRFRRPRDRQHAERQQQRMDEQHRARIGLAFAAVPHVVNNLDDAVGGPPEPRVDPGDRRDQRRIERREEQSGGRALLGAVGVVEHAVAEHAVVVQVVGDAQVEGLVEIAQPFFRPRQNGGGQGGEDQDAERDPAADVVQAVHRFGPWHAIATSEIRCGNRAVALLPQCTATAFCFRCAQGRVAIPPPADQPRP